MEFFFFFYVFFFPSAVVGKQLLCLDGVRIVGKPQQLVQRTCSRPLGSGSFVCCSLFPGELVLSKIEGSIGICGNGSDSRDSIRRSSHYVHLVYYDL